MQIVFVPEWCLAAWRCVTILLTKFTRCGPLVLLHVATCCQLPMFWSRLFGRLLTALPLLQAAHQVLDRCHGAWMCIMSQHTVSAVSVSLSPVNMVWYPLVQFWFQTLCQFTENPDRKMTCYHRCGHHVEICWASGVITRMAFSSLVGQPRPWSECHAPRH